MLNINTNLSSLIVQSNLKLSTNGLNTAIERMTSGFRINHSKDNAANYAISTNLSTKMNAYAVAEENANLGLEMVLTASESLSLMSDLSGRLRNIAIQAQNGSYGNKSLSVLNSEAQSLIAEIYRIKETASYNGIKLFNDFNSTVPSFSDGSKLVPNDAGFLKDIVERDTSSMDKLEDVDSNSELKGGTYSISTEEGLVKLAQMSVNNKITGACEFVLAEDIDMSEFCKSNLDAKGEGGWIPIQLETSIFDGNGYTISGVYINRPSVNNQALFRSAVKVLNLGLITPEITGQRAVGTILGTSWSNIENCYIEGGNVTGKHSVGGISSGADGKSIQYCYATCNVVGEIYVGGIVGGAKHSAVNNCYFSGDVSGSTYVGGIIGNMDKNFYCSIRNSAVYGTVEGQTNVGVFCGSLNGDIIDCIHNKNVNTELSYAGNIVRGNISGITGINFSAKVGFQVGISSSQSSRLNFDAWFALDDLGRLKKGKIEDKKVLTYIDRIISQISKKQTEYGAVQKRLESVLEQISVSYENLLSHQSTICDADIAEESSAYIRSQILQQASATLLATANQSPSIALQLL